MFSGTMEFKPLDTLLKAPISETSGEDSPSDDYGEDYDDEEYDDEESEFSEHFTESEDRHSLLKLKEQSGSRTKIMRRNSTLTDPVNSARKNPSKILWCAKFSISLFVVRLVFDVAMISLYWIETDQNNCLSKIV